MSKIKLIHAQPCPKCAHLGIIGAILNKIGAIAHCTAQTSDAIMPIMSEIERDFLMIKPNLNLMSGYYWGC